MNGAEMMTAIFIPLSFFALVFGVVYLHKRENLAMIEKGMNPKDKIFRPAPFRSLKLGLLLLGAGMGLLTAFLIDAAAFNDDYRFRHDGLPALYFSLIGIGGGLGLVVSYFVEKKHWYDKRNGNGE